MTGLARVPALTDGAFTFERLRFSSPILLSRGKELVCRMTLKEQARRLREMADAIRRDYDRHGRSLQNPGFVALCVYRYGRWAIGIDSPRARKTALKLHGAANLVVANITKVWIPPEVKVGEGLHLIHAEGSVSFHPAVQAGDRLGVMHNVTIGTNMTDGAPKIGDDVFIGVNSTVLGDIKIGDRVRIAANTAVTTDVPNDSIVVGSPAKIYPRLTPFKRPTPAPRKNSQTR